MIQPTAKAKAYYDHRSAYKHQTNKSISDTFSDILTESIKEVEGRVIDKTIKEQQSAIWLKELTLKELHVTIRSNTGSLKKAAYAEWCTREKARMNMEML
jgi:hypothetical protein